MRFLAALRHAGYARYLESTFRALCERGHEVVVLVGVGSAQTKSHVSLMSRFDAELERLAAELPGLTVRRGVEARGSRQRDLGGSLRVWLDYLRFLEPEFEDAPKLRERARSNLPEPLRDPMEAGATSPAFRAALGGMLRTIEQALPVPEAVQAIVGAEQPDAVLVCPLLERRSPQSAYLRAAHELGVPGAVCVASWDNLTTSSLIHGDPDLVTVWNEAQRDEATSLHGIPAARVAVTGAPHYDRWFDQAVTSSPEDFRQRVGLPADRPFVLYVCSSGFIAPDEAAWILEWIDLVRQSGAAELTDLPVLIRPHPHSRLLDGSAAAAELERLPGIAIHPRDGALSISGEEIDDYFDSIHHAAAVVGVNTSAMLESAIVGRGVHVLLTRRYRETQDGVPHFAHLRSAGGGLIQASKKERKHVAGLARAVRGEDRELAAERSRRFLEAFVRPNGLDEPATPAMVEQLEQLAKMSPPPPQRAPGPPAAQLQQTIASLERIFRLRGGDAAD